MTPFLLQASARGLEEARRIRAADTPDEMRTLLHSTAMESGGIASVLADRYLFFITAAEKTVQLPRGSAACYDAAAAAAMTARAYPDALAALEKAEGLRPCPDRQKKIRQLRHNLVPTVEPQVAKSRVRDSAGSLRRR